MADASIELREQLLPRQRNRNIWNLSQQEPAVHLESSERQQADEVQSSQSIPTRPQSSLELKIPGWPDRPLPLTQSRRDRLLSVALDSILIIGALLFLALAAGALVVSGRPVGDKSGQLIEEASKLGPTIFPIIFAALIGRALKAIGRFKSEEGIEMSTLWAFLSIKTAFDAFLLQWSAGAFSLPTILVGLLWAMSPAGGQASLRILYRTSQTSLSSASIRYMDTGPLGILYTYVTLLEGDDLGPKVIDFPFSMSSSCAAALLQDIETKSGPRDSWGNPKIPRLDMMNYSAPDENGWFEVSQPTMMESFSSLFGVPLLGVPDQGTVEFGIESAYVQLDTFSVESIEPVPLEAHNSWGLKFKCSTCITAEQDLSDRELNRGRASQLLGSPWLQPNSTQLSQESYTNAHIIRFEQSHYSTNLSAEATQVLVETQIVCEEGICKATKVRPSTTDHRPRNMTAFDAWGVLALNLLNQTNVQTAWNSPTMLELFMNRTSTIPLWRGNYMVSEDSKWFNTNFARGEPEILSNRATILLNTAMHLLYSYYGFAGVLPSAEVEDWGPAHVPADGLHAAAAAYNATPGRALGDADGYVLDIVSADAAFVAASTEASVTRKAIIYKADYAYVTVLVISSLALIIIGTVGIAMSLRTRGPDVFDSLMGLTYNNGAMGLSNPGSTLDANTRAKLLRSMRVRLGDISGGESVGMVGVGRAPEVVSLVQGRLYE